MVNMQCEIEKVLARKRKFDTEDQPQVRKFSNINCNISGIPSFSITDVNVFLKFEKDLIFNHLFGIAFHRIIKICNFFNNKDNVLSNCLNAIVSKNILKHFKWESETDQFHSLSKFPNFISLLLNVVVALKNESVKFTRSEIETFLRIEILKESKPPIVPIQIPKLPNLNQNYIVKKLSTRNEKVIPDKLIIRKIPKPILNRPMPLLSQNISSIGIDEADLQSEITTTEIDSN